MPENPKAPFMANLLVVGRAIQHVASLHPPEAAPFFMAAYNAVLDMVPEAAMHMWNIVKLESRFEQHKLDCTSCKPYPNELDCSVATKLKSKITVAWVRLDEAEKCRKTPQL